MRNDIYKLIAALLIFCAPCFAQSKSSGASGAGTALVSSRPSTVFTAPVALDIYGGRTDKPCTNATGHFITLKLANGHWGFCDALGNFFVVMGSSNILTNGNPTNDCTGTNTFTIYNTKYGGVAPSAAWSTPQTRRSLGWGLNVIGEDSNITNSMPYILELKPAEDAAVNVFGYLTTPLPDIEAVTDAHFTFFKGGSLYDAFNPALHSEWSQELAANKTAVNALKANDPHIVFLLTDDSDFFTGSGAGPDFTTAGVGSSHTNPNIAFTTIISSPVQTFNPFTEFEGKSFLYSDSKNYSKSQVTNPAHGTCSISSPCSLRDYLYDKYSGSISSLNTAWGSNYTTFDSTGTQVTAEQPTGFTGDGTTRQFSGTLAHNSDSPVSFTISVGGTAQIGDCPWWHVKCVATNSNFGTFGSPTANYLVPAVSIASGGKVTESGNTVTVIANNTFTAGLSVHVDGLGVAAYNGTWTLTSATATQFQYTNPTSGLASSGNGWASENYINYATGAVILTFVTAPANAAAITVNYIFGGWGAGGTGLMDENGAGSWVGTNNFCLEGANASYPNYFSCTGGGAGYNAAPNANATMAADLDGWIPEFAAKYFKTMHDDLRAAPSNISYFGLDVMGGYGEPTFSKFLQGAAPYLDGGWVSLLEWRMLSHAQLNAAYQYTTQYLGDIPIVVWGIVSSGGDSAYYCNGASDEPTQALRGYVWYQNAKFLLTTSSFNSDFQMAGIIEWSWQDFQGINQGLMSLRDNPYDGTGCYLQVDALGNTNVPDEKCFGDFLSWMVKTNYLWFQF